MYILSLIIKCLVIAVPLILAVAYFTLLERKVMEEFSRRGPDVVERRVFLQPLQMP